MRKIIEIVLRRTASSILNENWDKVERMVASLLEYETVEAEEVRAILEGRPYDRSKRRRGRRRQRCAGRASRATSRSAPKSRRASRRRYRRNRHDAARALSRGDARASRRSSFAAPARAAMRAADSARCRAADPTCSIPIRPSGPRRSAFGFARRERATTTRRPASRISRRRPRRSRRSRAASRSTRSCTPSAGELNIEVYPDIVGIAAVVPASAARRIVAAMTAAYFAPAVDDAAVKTARANAAVLGVQQRYESDTTLHDLLFEQIFADGPAHYPPLPTSVVAAHEHHRPRKSSAFAKRAFRAENSVLTLTRQRRRVEHHRGDRRQRRGRDGSAVRLEARAVPRVDDGDGRGRRRRTGVDRSADLRRKSRDGTGFRRRLSLSR